MLKSSRPDRTLLSAVPLFYGIDDAACDHAIAAARFRHAPKGTSVFEQGDPASAFFVLADGHLKIVQTTAAGQQMIVHFVNPGDFFGCVALMGSAYYPGSAIANEDSSILYWTLADARGLIERHPAIAANALAGFGDRLLRMNARLREVHTEPAEQRIAHALIDLIERSGRAIRSGVAIDFPITRQEVAEIAGTTLHTASRTISRWVRDGIVSNGRRQIVVADIERLRAIAAEPQG